MWELWIKEGGWNMEGWVLPMTLTDLWYTRCGNVKCGCYVVHGTTSNVWFLFGSFVWVSIQERKK